MSVKRVRRTPLVCALAVLLLGFFPILTARADLTVCTPEDAVNSLGQRVKATATFTIEPHRVIVRLTNDTPGLCSTEQILRGISFRIKTDKPLEAHKGKSQGHMRALLAESFADSAEAGEVPWLCTVRGNQVSLDAPGTRFGIISDPTPPAGKYVNAEEGLFHKDNNPYLCKTVTIEVLIPGDPLTESLYQVVFSWEHTVGLAEGDEPLTGPTGSAFPSESGPDVPVDIGEPPGGVIPPGSPLVPSVPPELPPQNPFENPPGIPPGNPPSGPTTPDQPPELPPPGGPSSSVPEPGTVAVLGLGGLLGLGRRRGR